MQVVQARLEDVQLADADFDSVVAATAMHWVDLSIGLPKLHRALRRGGWFAVWRNVFGDDSGYPVPSQGRRHCGEAQPR
ncbi:MAG: methyltransferase domain-containing protein [Tessaracoccus sp.]|nr:methyltransferase domain-containing protein [Tessaracoccus sp.]